MVVKVMSSTPSVVIPIRYNESKVSAGVAEVLAMINIPDDTYESMYHELADRENENIRTEKPSLHISFNPAPEDEFDDEKMEEYIKEWMSCQGLGDQPYTIYKHNDIFRGHYHVVSTKLMKNGYSVKCHNLGYRNRHIMLDLQDKYGYIIGPSKCAECEMERFHFDPEKGQVWKQMDYIVDSVVSSFHYRSDAEFRTIMEACGLRCDIKTSKHGQDEKTMILHYTKNDGQITGRPKYFDNGEYELMRQQFAKSKPKTALVVRDINEAIAVASSAEDFQVKMQELHYYVRPFYNARGNYQGLSIVDFNENDVVKASELGQETASMIRALFSENIDVAKALLSERNVKQSSSNDKKEEYDYYRERQRESQRRQKKQELQSAYYQTMSQYRDCKQICQQAYSLYLDTARQLNMSYEEISSKRTEYNKLVKEYVESTERAKKAENMTDALTIMVAVSLALSPLLCFILSLLMGILKASESREAEYKQELCAKAIALSHDIETLYNKRAIQKSAKSEALSEYIHAKDNKNDVMKNIENLKATITDLTKPQKQKEGDKPTKTPKKKAGMSIG